MDNIGRVQKLEGAQRVIGDDLQVLFLQSARITKLYKVLQIMLRRLHHDEDMPYGVRFIFVFRSKYIEQLWRKLLQLCALHHFGEFTHNLYFAQDLDARVLVLLKVGNELDGDILAR